MMIQYSKFLKIGQETTWRNKTPSLNYIETSTLWRQEHNGFSHQDPMFINTVMNLKSHMVRIYFPPDANCMLSVINHCMKSKSKINLDIGTKNPMPTYLSLEDAIKHCVAGASVWKFVSSNDGCNPDVVVVGCGNETNLEAVEACKMLISDCPDIRIRMVNLVDLMILDSKHVHALTPKMFDALFTADRPVIFNFHGYPSVIRALILGQSNPSRFMVNGYIEEGTTTSPFKMLVANKVSRYHVAMQALSVAAHYNDRVAVSASLLSANYEQVLRVHDYYIRQTGKDPEGITEFGHDVISGKIDPSF
jgi:xylulose-5-phosphate/fructose-6-phosphate phosphoketolase